MRGENFPLTTRNLPLLIRKISTVYIAADAVAISKAIKFYFDLIAETSGMGTTRWINNHVKEFPIPNTSPEIQSSISEIVDQILIAKQANPKADTADLEAKTDESAYDLYGFTEQEIKIVEGISTKGEEGES